MLSTFRFKHFDVHQSNKRMKVNTDGVLIGAWANVNTSKTILDVGTGTGVIALMMAQRSNAQMIHAVEIDSEAAKIAEMNAKNSIWSDRINVYHSSIQEYADLSSAKYDLIVSNPPFFNSGTTADQQAIATARHTASLSHEELINCCYRLLSSNGSIAIILPSKEGDQLIEYAQNLELYLVKVTELYPDQQKPIERKLLMLSKQKSQLKANKLYIRDADTRDFSKEYRELTKNFYLKF